MKHILYILLWMSAFGCTIPTNPTVTPEWELEIIPRLDIHNNNYILPLTDNSLQTIHRISGRILKDGEEPYPPEKVSWESSHYWVLSDTIGYIIRRTIHNGKWTPLDTLYISGFSNHIVPTINPTSYSGRNGEINTMIAPIRDMKGDTMIVRLIHRELEAKINIILQ